MPSTSAQESPELTSATHSEAATETPSDQALALQPAPQTPAQDKPARKKPPRPKFADVDSYIASFPPLVQRALTEVRTAIRQAAPRAVEGIAYDIPTFELQGNLVSFAAWHDHLGLYGTSSATGTALQNQLAPYVGPADSLKFPYNRTLPLRLISQVVRIRVEENQAKAAAESA